MGFFGSLLQAAVDTATLPIVAAIDVVELGKNNRTGRHVDKIAEALDDAIDSY